jgi:hypothetical protein
VHPRGFDQELLRLPRSYPIRASKASSSRWRSLQSSEKLARRDRQRAFTVEVEWEFFAEKYRVITFQLTPRT